RLRMPDSQEPGEVSGHHLRTGLEVAVAWLEARLESFGVRGYCLIADRRPLDRPRGRGDLVPVPFQYLHERCIKMKYVLATVLAALVIAGCSKEPKAAAEAQMQAEPCIGS